MKTKVFYDPTNTRLLFSGPAEAISMELDKTFAEHFEKVLMGTKLRMQPHTIYHAEANEQVAEQPQAQQPSTPIDYKAAVKQYVDSMEDGSELIPGWIKRTGDNGIDAVFVKDHEVIQWVSSTDGFLSPGYATSIYYFLRLDQKGGQR